MTVSYFEQVQGAANFFWKEDEVERKLQDRMDHALDGVLAQAHVLGSSLRDGALTLAVRRIAEALVARGSI